MISMLVQVTECDHIFPESEMIGDVTLVTMKGQQVEFVEAADTCFELNDFFDVVDFILKLNLRTYSFVNE